jgi:Xaa-Pro aminopeptidase
MFHSDVYAKRRKRLKQDVGSGLILFLGHGQSPINYLDNPYPFRQDSSFLYFWGLDHPKLAAVIDTEENKEIVFGNNLTSEERVWAGPKTLLKEKCRRIGIKEALSLDQLEGVITKALHKNRKIHFLPQCRAENVLKVMRLLGIDPAAVQDRVSTILTEAVVTQRSVKSEAEIEEIEAALDITYEMHTLPMKMSKPGMFEREAVGAMIDIAYCVGSRLSFPIIFSTRGEIIHNPSHGGLMKTGDMVINDSGAESPLHYATDITRTFPVSEKFTKKQKDIYEIVLHAQEKAIETISPGIEFRKIHLLACQHLVSGLKALNLMKGDIESAIRAGAHALFFPTGLGHMMGLDVHDMENIGEDYVGYTDTIQRNHQFGLNNLRLAKTLETGFVLTVEPGLYFIPELIDQWKAENKFADYINYQSVEAYKDFGGIRIEDDILVMESGARVLGKPIPKSIEEVEAFSSQ